MDCTKCNWPTPESCRACKAEQKEKEQRELAEKEKTKLQSRCYTISIGLIMFAIFLAALS